MGTKRNNNKEFNEMRFKVASRTREEFFKDEEAMRNAVIYLLDNNKGFTREVDEIKNVCMNINQDRYEELEEKLYKICYEYEEYGYQLSNYLRQGNDYAKVFNDFWNENNDYLNPYSNIGWKKNNHDKRISLYIECPSDCSYLYNDRGYDDDDDDDYEEQGNSKILFDGTAEDILNGTCEGLNQLKEGLKLHKKGDPFLATPQQREELNRKIKDMEERMSELSNECHRLEDLNQNDRKPILFGKKKYNKRVQERETQIEELKNQWTDLNHKKSNELRIHGDGNSLASYKKIFYTEEDRKKYDEAMKDFYNWFYYGEYENYKFGRFVEIDDRCMSWIEHEMYIPYVQAFVDLVEEHRDLFEKMAKLEKEFEEQSKEYKIACANRKKLLMYEEAIKVLGIDSDVVKNLKKKENLIAQKLNNLTVEELEYISESGKNVNTELSDGHPRKREVYLDIYNNICKDIKNFMNEKLNQNENIQQNNQNRPNPNNKISKKKQVSNSKKNQKITHKKQDEYAGD